MFLTSPLIEQALALIARTPRERTGNLGRPEPAYLRPVLIRMASPTFNSLVLPAEGHDKHARRANSLKKTASEKERCVLIVSGLLLPLSARLVWCLQRLQAATIGTQPFAGHRRTRIERLVAAL